MTTTMGTSGTHTTPAPRAEAAHATDELEVARATMQAIRFHRYGGPEVLRLEDVPAPVPAAGEVVVRVRAASVNALDWHSLRALPHLVRTSDGFRRPRSGVLGADMAGTVSALGPGVTGLAVGDEVLGMAGGTFAEQVLVKTEGVVPKPANLTFEQAAALPVAGTTALQGLRDKGRLRAGQRVLVNGAGGGVGTLGVQIAKALGGHVTAVTHPRSLDLVRALGADEAIDHTATDFTRTGQTWDLILDVGGNVSFRDASRVMVPTGVLVIVGPPAGNWLAPIRRPVMGAIRSRLGSRTFAPFLSHRDHDDLVVLRDLAEAGRLTPVIDSTFSLADVPAAIHRIESGEVRGKVVVRVA
jgi:NADPH:quinone reductase-like Zn-dependent oxidoreductase